MSLTYRYPIREGQSQADVDRGVESVFRREFASRDLVPYDKIGRMISSPPSGVTSSQVRRAISNLISRDVIITAEFGNPRSGFNKGRNY